MDRSAESPGHEDEERIGSQYEQRELRVERDHRADRGRVEDRRLDHVQESDSHQQPDRIDVVDATAHQIAGAPARVEGLRELLKVGVDVVAELVFDLARGVEDEGSREVTHHGRDQRRAEQPGHPPQQLRLGPPLGHGLDAPSHQARDDDEAGDVDEGQRHPDPVVEGMASDVARQASQRGAHSGGRRPCAHRAYHPAIRSRSTPAAQALAAIQWRSIVRSGPFSS